MRVTEHNNKSVALTHLFVDNLTLKGMTENIKTDIIIFSVVSKIKNKIELRIKMFNEVFLFRNSFTFGEGHHMRKHLSKGYETGTMETSFTNDSWKKIEEAGKKVLEGSGEFDESLLDGGIDG